MQKYLVGAGQLVVLKKIDSAQEPKTSCLSSGLTSSCKLHPIVHVVVLSRILGSTDSAGGANSSLN